MYNKYFILRMMIYMKLLWRLYKDTKNSNGYCISRIEEKKKYHDGSAEGFDGAQQCDFAGTYNETQLWTEREKQAQRF